MNSIRTACDIRSLPRSRRSPPRCALAACAKPRRHRQRRPRPRRPRPRRRAAKAADAEHAEAGIAWRQAANDAEVDAAFATRAAENKPVFVVLGREVVPAVQPGEGDALQPPGLHRALARLRAGLRRRRQPRRAEARRALQGQRLSDDGAVHAAGRGADAAARRGRAGPLHRGAHARHERGAAGQARCSPTRSPAGDAAAPTTGACSPSIRGTPTSSSWSPSDRRAGDAAGTLADACPAGRARRPRRGCG